MSQSVSMRRKKRALEMKLKTDYLGFFGKLEHRPNEPTAIVIHHTCTKNPEKTRKALKNKGCSTHFEIDTNGDVYQYVDPMEIALHCGSANVHTIGIDVTHVSHAKFTDRQYASYIELIDLLCDKYGIKKETHDRLEGVWPHCALGRTECPQGFDIHCVIGSSDTENDSDDIIRRIHDLVGIALAEGRKTEFLDMLNTSFKLSVKG